ncbi:unnamed protein product [Acanthosepion pharaonis]|uniref:Reelin domain-containing protein n=1 Tax=Acanthosepion pharaonis TaxID=158019 RepID=A0A812B1N0_ACAPH|nr:unnamed protein product [Sepia pharaonis]
MLVAVPNNTKIEDKSLGTFKLYDNEDVLQVAKQCNHTVIVHRFLLPKKGVYVMWKAPERGSGCVQFRATVIEEADLWYKDHGDLTKVICEEPSKLNSFSVNLAVFFFFFFFLFFFFFFFFFSSSSFFYSSSSTSSFFYSSSSSCYMESMIGMITQFLADYFLNVLSTTCATIQLLLLIFFCDIVKKLLFFFTFFSLLFFCKNYFYLASFLFV